MARDFHRLQSIRPNPTDVDEDVEYQHGGKSGQNKGTVYRGLVQGFNVHPG